MFKEKYGQWALITGASSGIGEELALISAERGLNVILVARREERLKKLSARIIERFKVDVKVIALDLLGEGAVRKLADQTKGIDIGLVIPNAGIEVNGDFVDGDIQSNERVVNLNVLVPMQIANLFGKRLAARGKGGILFVSSLFAYQGVPLVANYAATKAYILSLGEALNVELAPFGVDVTVLSPGLTDTEMPKGMPFDLSKMPITISTSRDVACVGLDALGRKATVVPGLINKFYAWTNRFIPRSFPVNLFGFLLKRASVNGVGSGVS